MGLLRAFLVLRAIWPGIKHAWWINTHKGPWSVDRFGAVGDGVHDDGPAFQSAVNVARMRGRGVVQTSSNYHRIGQRI